MTRLQEAIGLGLVLGVVHGLLQPAHSVPVVPNFTQGSMTSHTETTGNLSPGTGSVNVNINGVTSSWTGATSKPVFSQTTTGAPFQFTETYRGPGLSNHTIIQRTTEIRSVTDTTSIFSQ
jgi:hypothetical protein